MIILFGVPYVEVVTCIESVKNACKNHTRKFVQSCSNVRMGGKRKLSLSNSHIVNCCRGKLYTQA